MAKEEHAKCKYRRGARKIRDSEVWELRQDGMCQKDIAKKLGVTQGAVSLSLSRSEDKYYGVMMEDIHKYKMMQVRSIHAAAQNALEQYYKSQQDLIKTRQKGIMVNKAFVGSVETTIEKISSRGDANLLNLYFRGMEECRKILGIDKTPKDLNMPEFGKPNAMLMSVDDKVALFQSIPIDMRLELIGGMLTNKPAETTEVEKTE